MQLHELKPIHKKKAKKRVGRGGKRGTYSGRGLKGQSSRAGRKMQPIIRNLIKRYHKKRGYRVSSMLEKPAVVNLSALEKVFTAGEKINPMILVEKGLVEKRGKDIPKVKILSQGELTKKIVIESCLVSAKAREKIEKAGGKIV